MGILIFWLVLLFPIAEVYIIAKVGARIGFWDTLSLLIISAMFGSYLAKIQGKIAVQRIQACLTEGRMPTLEMVDGVLIFIGGLLFVLPGFISDGLGLLLIFPPTRWIIRIFFLAAIQSKIQPIQSPGSGAARRQQSSKPVGHDGAVDAEIVE